MAAATKASVPSVLFEKRVTTQPDGSITVDLSVPTDTKPALASAMNALLDRFVPGPSVPQQQALPVTSQSPFLELAKHPEVWTKSNLRAALYQSDADVAVFVKAVYGQIQRVMDIAKLNTAELDHLNTLLGGNADKDMFAGFPGIWDTAEMNSSYETDLQEEQHPPQERDGSTPQTSDEDTGDDNNDDDEGDDPDSSPVPPAVVRPQWNSGQEEEENGNKEDDDDNDPLPSLKFYFHNLPPISVEKLEAMCSVYGKLIPDTTYIGLDGQGRRIGFVTFADKACGHAAWNNQKGSIPPSINNSMRKAHNQDVIVHRPVVSQRPKYTKETFAAKKADPLEPNANLFVTNVPLEATDDDLFERFKGYGPIVSSRIVQPQTELKHPFYQIAFVHFERLEDAITAKMDNQQAEVWTVQYADPARARYSHQAPPRMPETVAPVYYNGGGGNNSNNYGAAANSVANAGVANAVPFGGPHHPYYYETAPQMPPVNYGFNGYGQNFNPYYDVRGTVPPPSAPMHKEYVDSSSGRQYIAASENSQQVFASPVTYGDGTPVFVIQPDGQQQPPQPTSQHSQHPFAERPQQQAVAPLTSNPFQPDQPFREEWKPTSVPETAFPRQSVPPAIDYLTPSVYRLTDGQQSEHAQAQKYPL